MYFIHAYQAILNLFKSKISILLKIVAAFLLPIVPCLLLIGFMMCLDVITGLWKARKLGERITSYKLSRTSEKAGIYGVGIVTLFILETFLLGEIVQHFFAWPLILTKLLALFFIAIEVKSINENIEAAYGVNFFKIFRNILKRTKEVKQDIDEIVGGNNANTTMMD